MRVISLIQHYRRDAVFIALIVAAAALPRLIGLGTFLTADEKNWIGRSHEFIRAFADGRYNDMLQTTHPGVTTLWLAGAAVAAKTWLDGLSFSFEVLAHFVRLPQLAMALANTVLIAATYVLLVKLLHGRRSLALFSALLLALNPLLVGYGRVVHVDALLAHLVFAAALLILLYAQDHYRRKWLYASAAATALALLTKAPAVFLLPWFGFVVWLHERSRLLHWYGLRARLADVLRWLAVIVVLGIVLWPALLWVPNPKGNVLLLKRDIGQAATTPHHMSDEYAVNAYFYPATLLTRTTPWVQAGVLAALVFAAVRRRGQESTFVWWLMAYIFFFVLMMTLGAKKGDRYILPVLPALDVIAAVGFSSLFGWIAMKSKVKSQKSKIIFKAVLTIAVVGSLGATVYRYHPYAIAYTNPLWPDNLSQERGWGEGLEQVAAWLNEHDPQAIVASWYPEELGAFTSARVAHINAHEQHQVRYIVLYHNMFGRPADHPANDFIDEYFKKREPVFVAYVAGKPFAWVYAKPTFPHVVGELVSPMSVGQEVAPLPLPLAAVEIVAATYSGRAQSGELIVRLREHRAGTVLEEWRMPVRDIVDNQWLRFSLDSPRVFETAFVEISSAATAEQAPTVRYGREREWRPGNFFVNDSEKQGDLALRLRYVAGSEEITEEHTKLLSEHTAR